MSARSFLEIRAAGAPAFVQDLGRPGRAHEGVPAGGVLLPALLVAGNRAVGNEDGAAGLEAYGALRLFAPGRRIAIDGLGLDASDGERVVPAPDRLRARIVAIEGGLDVPVVLGGRGTLPVARLGGLDGRALRRGDRLPLGPPASAAPHVGPPPPALPLDAPIRIEPGPDLDRFVPEALDVLCAGRYRVHAASDRTGTRLQGPALPRRDDDRALSLPMSPGAIEVTADGAPIVLGPDHPTTGGYPILAVVLRADRGRLWSLRPGAELGFTRAR